MLPTALVAFKHMTAHDGSAASEYILERTSMARQHLVAEPLQILSAVASENICYFDHVGSTADH